MGRVRFHTVSAMNSRRPLRARDPLCGHWDDRFYDTYEQDGACRRPSDRLQRSAFVRARAQYQLFEKGQVTRVIVVREFFLRSPRLGFSVWTHADLQLAFELWGDPEVTR